MKWNRKLIVFLILICAVSWGLAFVLKARRAEGAFPEFDQPTFLIFQLNIGQGDSLLLVSPDRRVTLVDGGPSFRSRGWSWDAGLEVIWPVLRYLDLDGIDQVILTHHDLDHLGGVLSLLGRFRVGRVFDNGRFQGTRAYRDFLARIRKFEIPLTVLKEGDRLALGEYVTAQVLSPRAAEGPDENDASLVMKVLFGNLELLLTGDIGSGAERELCLRYGRGLQCDVMKVPHHGSKSSSSFPFLRLTRPSLVTVSAGKRNPYGHPAPAVLERYRRLVMGCRIARTDEEGTILMVSNGAECFMASEQGRLEPVGI